MSRLNEATLERHIGDRIRRRRAEVGLTQEDLGRALGISYQQIQKYESGANRISASRLRALAERLEVGVTWFYEGFGEGGPSFAAGHRHRAAIGVARTFDGIDDAGVRSAVRALVRAVIDRQTPA